MSSWGVRLTWFDCNIIGVAFYIFCRSFTWKETISTYFWLSRGFPKLLAVFWMALKCETKSCIFLDYLRSFLKHIRGNQDLITHLVMRDKIIWRRKLTWFSSSCSNTLRSLLSHGIKRWEQAGLTRKNAGAMEYVNNLIRKKYTTNM